jgi:hypothetical protein
MGDKRKTEGDNSMKALLIGIFAGAVLCGASLAQNATQPSTNDTMPQSQQNPATTQSAQSSSEPASQAPRIAPGSVIPIELTKSIDAKKVKAGDQVEAKVTQDLKAGNGEVVVPKDTQVVGHITEAHIRNKEQKESQVGIAFGRAVMKTGGEVPLPMSIQAIIASPTSNADNSNANGESAAPPAYGPTAGGMGPSNNSGRSAGMGTPTPRPTTPVGESSTSSQTERTDHQPVTGNTQGVVGIANLKLSMATNPKEGSIVSSEKNNVKLQSGTLMLLRVNP